MVEHQVDTGAAGHVPGPGRHVYRAVIAGVFSAQFHGFRAFFPAAGSCQHGRSRLNGQLNGGNGHAAAGSMDKHRLPGPESACIEQGVVRGHPAGGEYDGMAPRHVTGNRVQVGLRRQAFLRVTACNGSADDPKKTVQVVQARQLRALGYFGHGRVYQHPVARSDAGHVRTGLDHRTGNVHPGDVRQTEPGDGEPAVTLRDVKAVYRRCRNLDHRVPRPRFGVGDIPVAEHLRPAMLFIDQCFHPGSPVIIGDRF